MASKCAFASTARLAIATGGLTLAEQNPAEQNPAEQNRDVGGGLPWATTTTVTSWARDV